MPQPALNEFIELYPGIRGSIFTPSPGQSRTWIFCAIEEPQRILDYHFSFLLTHGWRVLQSEPSIIAQRGDADISVSTLRRNDETRIVYELRTGT